MCRLVRLRSVEVMTDSVLPRDSVLTQRRNAGWMFLIEAARDMRTIGAIAPSGTALASRLTDPLREHAGRPMNVLEAGAGTGSVTRTLISRLSPGSRLDIVEPNPRFAERLSHLVRTHPALAATPERVRVHSMFIEQLETDHRYDVIVSGLPFTNFSPEQVETIMERYLRLLHPGGTLTYFAYRGTHLARSLLASSAEARRHHAVTALLVGYQRQYATGCRTVWANLPPARAWRLRTPANNHGGTTP